MEEWHYQPAGDLSLKPGESLRSLQREGGLVSAITQTAWRALVRVYLRGYHRLQVEGMKHVPPKPPFVMIGNHSSHLDALVLASSLPWRLRRSVFPIAAGDVFFETPAVALFSAMMLNALPMWRKRCGSHAMQELRDRLIGGPSIYILFPEGTRSRDGSMGRFKPGLGMIIAGTPVPIVPCHLEGAFAASPPGARIPRPLPLRLRIGAPLTFADSTNDRAGWQEIARRSEDAVRALQTSASQPRETNSTGL